MNVDLVELLENGPGVGFDPTFIHPRGSEDPQLYIVAETGGWEERKQGLTLVGPSGDLIEKAIKAAGVDESLVRFWNVTPWSSITTENGKSFNRNPSPEEINKLSVFVKNDIKKRKNLKSILLLGRSAMTGFGIDMAVGASRNYTYNWENIPIYTTYHPAYVLRQGGENTPAFKDIVSDIKKSWNPQIKITEANEFEIIDVTEWDKIEKAFSNETEITLRMIPANGLDYETSGLRCYHKDFILGGIALAGVNTEKVYYVKIYDFWRTDREWTFPEELKKRIGEWLFKKKLIVYNMQYEMGVTLTVFHKYLRNVIDILMWNRMLLNSGSLKDVAARRLNVTKWNTEVEDWNILIQTIFNRLKSRNSRKNGATPSWEITQVINNDIKTIEDLLKLYEGKELGVREKSIHDSFTKLNTLVSKYFSGDRKKEFDERFLKLTTIRCLKQDTTLRFTDCPIEIIGPYGADDVGYTCKLYIDVRNEIIEKDLVRAADIYNCQGKLGFEIESSGIAWDNEEAGKLGNLYYGVALDNLRKLMLSKKFTEVLELGPSDILKIQTTVRLEDLVSIFNPRSTLKKSRESLSKLMIDGRVRMMRMLYEIFKEWSHRPLVDANKQYPVLYPIIADIILMKDSKERIELLDYLVENSETIGKKIQNHPGNDPEKWKTKKGAKFTPPEIEIYLEYSKWRFTDLATGTFEELYQSYENIMGINIDDETTWTEEFKYLMWFRMYKKVVKSWSSYIWGSMGRGTICLINKKIDPSLVQDRVPGHLEEIPSSKQWISETDWGVCTAATKRWRSGTHTVPWNSELMDCRKSRFDDGVRIHWDYSQNEIRMLARMSKDERLIQAFLDGRDIHRYIASQVWRKPEKEVTTVERRFSKMSSFSLIYGDTPEGFASKFLHGDATTGKRIFEGFYREFPGVKLWILEKHREGIETGYVKTLFGDQIRVDMPYEALNLKQHEKDALLDNLFTNEVSFHDDFKQDKAMRFLIAKSLRNCQNYPIQSTSSTLAALGMYYMTEFARDNNMMSRIDCFTHDSGDIDCPLREVPRILSVLPTNSIGKLKDEFEVPLKTEFEMGVSGDSTIELEHLEVDGNIIKAHFGGDDGNKKSSLDKLTSKFDKYGIKYKYEIEKTKLYQQSLKELFAHKRAYAMSIGTSYDLVWGSIEIDFS